MSTELELKTHYHHGGLEAALLHALVAAGKNVERLTPADLQGADEFHVGGRQATLELLAQLGISPAMHLLDIGSGLGGPARDMAATWRCRVTGIDLSDEYVAVADSLTRRMGLANLVSFRPANASALGFPDQSFDGATLLHVGMNIADKTGAFAAVYRVLRPGGFFAIYDMMRLGNGDLAFPLPWAGGAATSFVASPADYRNALEGAGFKVTSERNRAAFALEFFAAMQARRTQGVLPPLGLNIVMGASAPQKTGNLAELIGRGVLAPVEIIARRLRPANHYQSEGPGSLLVQATSLLTETLAVAGSAHILLAALRPR